jgi:hypothetical protein
VELGRMVSHTIRSGSYCFVFKALDLINCTHSAVRALHIDHINLYVTAPQINHTIHSNIFQAHFYVTIKMENCELRKNILISPYKQLKPQK